MQSPPAYAKMGTGAVRAEANRKMTTNNLGSLHYDSASCFYFIPSWVDFCVSRSPASVQMCFFDQHRFTCGDWKWGHFRQHCHRDYRIGETCGMKLVMQIVPVEMNCKLCEKIDTKTRRLAAEVERVHRWEKEGNKFQASIRKSNEMIRVLHGELSDLRSEKARRSAQAPEPVQQNHGVEISS
jgi:hypothetical protein